MKKTPSLPLTIALIVLMLSVIWLTGSFNTEDELLKRLELQSVATVDNAELSRLRLIVDKLPVLHTLTVNLKGDEPLSEDIQAFTQLKKLVVMGQQQSNDISALYALTQLEALILQNIILQPKGDVLNPFKGKGLKELSLILCRLRTIRFDPKDFEELEQLDLRGNLLTLTNEDHGLHLLPNLKGLDLSHNELTRLPTELFYHPTLTCLSLAMNEIKNDPSPVVVQQSLLLADETTALKNLSLAQNQLIWLPDEVLDAKNLLALDVSSNQLNSISREINDLTQLKKLDLQNNQLTYLSHDLGGLSSLEDFDLSYNKLNYLCEGIEGWTSLKRLYLEHNELYQLSDTLLSLPHLRKITTEGNRILYSSREDEWKALLNARVYRGQMVQLPCTEG